MEMVRHLPMQAQEQLLALQKTLQETCDVQAIWVHGSAAMGCFNPASDLDVLAVAGALSQEKRVQLAQALLKLSGNPYPIELSILPSDGLGEDTHPYAYSFHYSEAWRERYVAHEIPQGIQRDPDLGAHFMIARVCGITLYGSPPHELLPDTDRLAYTEALRYDFDDLITADTKYAVLNACRVAAWLRADEVLSKRDGGLWGLANLPPSFAPLIEEALKAYEKGEEMPAQDIQGLLVLVQSMF